MTTSAFLIRRPPIAGESLSSFRQRVGWANGFRLFPALDERRRRSDHDRMIAPAERQWLADLHQEDGAILRGLTLQRWHGRLGIDNVNGRMPAWWISSRYGPNQPSYGPMVCDACLAEDIEPYFRLRWRLGFVTHCTVHRTLMRDRCFDCGVSPWPTGSAVFEHLHRSFTSLNKCWRCAVDSRTAPVAVPDAAVEQLATLSWLDDSHVTLGRSRTPTSEAFAALREVCQLFWRRRSAMAIASSKSAFAPIAEALLASPFNCNRIEIMPIKLRALLVPTAYQMLQDWPDRFLDFASSSGITRQHFFDTHERLPSWMLAVIDAHLAKQNRFVTVECVEQVFDEYRQNHGVAPLKAELIRRLGAGCRKALVELYQQRKEATEDETLRFYERYCALREKAMKHSQRRNPFIFNAAAVVGQLLGVLEVPIRELAPASLNLALKAPVKRSPVGHCRHLVDIARDDLHRACTDAPDWASTHRGNKREVRDCFRGMFDGLFNDLACDVSVFSNPPVDDGISSR